MELLLTHFFPVWRVSVYVYSVTLLQTISLTMHHCPKCEGIMQLGLLDVKCLSFCDFHPRAQRGGGGKEYRLRRVNLWWNAVWLWSVLTTEKSDCVCNRNWVDWRQRGGMRQASILLQSIQKQQDDATALNYPWCFAGKMNEVDMERASMKTHARSLAHNSSVF